MAISQPLSVRIEGETLRVAAPQLQFLGGDVLQRLHNGIAMNYVFKIGIAPDRYGKPINETTYRFVVSYDIFEEKFAVNRISPNPRSITHLSEAAAQAWCLDSLALSTTGLSPDQLFWVVLEYRSEEPKSSSSAAADSRDSMIDQLIDIFGRKSQRQESRGSFPSGPFRLSDLRKTR